MSERITIEETEDDHGMPAWRILNESDVEIGSITFGRERREWVAIIGGVEVASALTLTGAGLKVVERYPSPNYRTRHPYGLLRHLNNVVSMRPSSQSDGRHTPASTPEDSSTASHSFWSAVKRPFSVLSSRMRVRFRLVSTKSGKPTLL